METAENLIEKTAALHLISPNPIRMAWRTHYVGDLRAINNNVLDTYQLKSQNTILDANIEEIKRRPDGKLDVTFLYKHAEDHRDTRMVDRVILCTGFLFDDTIFGPECAPATVQEGKFPDVDTRWESTNVLGLFFAGALMHGRDYRESFSGFVHGFRYNIRFLDQLFCLQDLGQPLPVKRLHHDASALMEIIVTRMNRDSSLFQQPAFFCDLYRLGKSAIEAVSSIPIDYIADTPNLASGPCLQVTMEYGKLGPQEDPFNVFRYPDDGTMSKFIHPVLRYFEDGQLRAEYHIAEDLENNWDAPCYKEPALQWISGIFEQFKSASLAQI